MTPTSPNPVRSSECTAEPLPVDPFRSLRVRFGMLLGEEDFTTIGAYHRGKGWLHNAWLHRQGVVWGLGVELDARQGEIRVLPGLALDGLGRELHLDVPMCVNVGAWLDAQNPPAPVRKERGATLVDLHVVIRFRGCLDRPVPALSEPCEGSGATTAHSRVIEQVEILLRPGLAPQRSDPHGSTPPLLPYHRLRLLFGLEGPIAQEGGTSPIPADQEVLDARAAIAALPAADRPPALLEAFRRFAAYDEIGLQPAQDEDGEFTLMPVAEPGELVLAELRQLRLTGQKGAWKISSLQEVVHPEVRFSHVATSTLEELLCGAACCLAAASPPAPPDTVVGPQVMGEPRIGSGEITFTVSAPLAAASLAGGISVTHFDPAMGWTQVGVGKIGQADGEVQLGFPAKLPLGRLRLLIRGSGSQPVLGEDGIPFGARSGNPSDGNDFVYMTERK